ncbi:putative DNA binding domain-containing protein [Anaerostipes hadrus]|jgi:ATP-dependent DNA helicase RecG|nr:putative DNA binding domain-containing protein [Anaerostipes hadrus]
MIGEVILKNKLFSGESINIEYKVEMPKKSEKYMKTVVAFANGRGGRIVFGVDDKTLNIVGMNPDTIFQTMDAITNAISDSCEPKIYPDVTLQSIDDKTIIVVEIHPGPMRPYYIKNKGLVDGTYVRVAGTSRHAEGYMLKELILEGQNRYFDNEPCEYLEINEDDIKDLCDKMKKIAIENTWNDEEKAAIRDVTKNILITWGILKEDNGKIIPTNAYALLTGKMQIQPTIQCAVFKGKTRAYFVDRREFSGPIQDQVQLAFQYVLEKINMGMQIKGIYRQDVYELPINSVRELIANAVAHRNYLEPGNIQVAIFDDRLEVTSPGMLLNTVSIKKMIEGYSRLRNPAIANAFAYMKIIEKWGTGIPRILRECKEYGLKKPELIDFDGDFRVNMYRREEKSKTTQTTTQTTTQITTQTTTQITTQTTIKLTKNDHEILQVIQNNPALSQKEIAMELGWTVDRVKYYLNKMKKQEAIRRIGSSHKGYWELLIKL